MKINVKQLTRELEQERERIDNALSALAALSGHPKIRRGKGKRTMSATARKKIAAAQRKRWAEQKKAASKA